MNKTEQYLLGSLNGVEGDILSIQKLRERYPFNTGIMMAILPLEAAMIEERDGLLIELGRARLYDMRHQGERGREDTEDMPLRTEDETGPDTVC